MASSAYQTVQIDSSGKISWIESPKKEEKHATLMEMVEARWDKIEDKLSDNQIRIQFNDRICAVFNPETKIFDILEQNDAWDLAAKRTLAGRHTLALEVLEETFKEDVVFSHLQFSMTPDSEVQTYSLDQALKAMGDATWYLHVASSRIDQLAITRSQLEWVATWLQIPLQQVRTRKRTRASTRASTPEAALQSLLESELLDEFLDKAKPSYEIEPIFCL